MHPNESRNRARRVKLFCAWLDGHTLRLGCHPSARAELILAMLAGWTPAYWEKAAADLRAKRKLTLAQFKPLSATSRDAVFAEYRSRIIRRAAA